MVVMNTGHLRNKARTNIKKRNCGHDLTFDPGSVGCKDGFWSASRASHAELENPLRIEKALKAMPGLSGGRQLFRMKTQPSSKVKAIHGRDLDCRQNMIVDQHSMYGKVDASLPCPTGSTNENPVSGQNSLMLNESMVNDVSETGNSLSVVDCLPSTSGKAVGGESNCTQKRSCNRGIEDNRPKILYTSQAKGASTIDSETSTICINATHEKRKESVVCKNGNLHGMDMFQGSGFNSQVVKECPVSEGLLFPILEKPEKQTKQEVTREQGKHMSHKEGASSCPENLKLESFGHRNKNESLFKRDLGALFTDSGVRLTEILEGLASLDNNGFFSNAMENPFVVDHPRISRKNICFSVMREKIQSKNYETWRSFVDDFEDICHNAMNNHEKGSRIWDAANTLLYEGKKYLEQYADRALAFFGLSTKVEHRRTCGVEASNNGHCIKLDKVGHTVHQEGECSFSQSNKELIGTVSHGKCSNFPNQKSVNPLSRRDMTVLPPDERLQNVSGSTLVCTQNMVYVPEEDCRSNPEYTFDANEVNEEANDSIVEILEEIGDDIRSNPSEQATECSSSFGDIQLDTDDDDAGCKMYDAAEVQSESRNGNGAAIPSEDNTSRKGRRH